MRPRYHHRTLRNERGTLVAHWHSVSYKDQEAADRWLTNQETTPAAHRVVAALRGKFIALRYITTLHRYRGKGYGNKAMQQFLSYAKKRGCRYAMLVADVSGEQKPGFDLVGWYRKRGFKKIGTASYIPAPVMLADLNNLKG